MSNMYLSGSSGTGAKIIKYSSHFTCNFICQEEIEDGIIYKFTWRFDSQHGIMSIIVQSVDGKISNSSLINTDNNSNHAFSRPLGLYNDNSLATVFENALSSVDVNSNGI